MSEWQGPQTQIRGGVWDWAKHKFDRLDKLVDENISKRVMAFWLSLRLQDLLDLYHVFITWLDKWCILSSNCLILNLFRFDFDMMTSPLIVMIFYLSL